MLQSCAQNVRIWISIPTAGKEKDVFLKKNKMKKENAFILKEVKGGKVHDQYIEVNKKSWARIGKGWS